MPIAIRPFAHPARLCWLPICRRRRRRRVRGLRYRPTRATFFFLSPWLAGWTGWLAGPFLYLISSLARVTFSQPFFGFSSPSYSLSLSSSLSHNHSTRRRPSSSPVAIDRNALATRFCPSAFFSYFLHCGFPPELAALTQTVGRRLWCIARSGILFAFSNGPPVAALFVRPSVGRLLLSWFIPARCPRHSSRRRPDKAVRYIIISFLPLSVVE